MQKSGSIAFTCKVYDYSPVLHCIWETVSRRSIRCDHRIREFTHGRRRKLWREVAGVRSIFSGCNDDVHQRRYSYVYEAMALHMRHDDVYQGGMRTGEGLLPLFLADRDAGGCHRLLRCQSSVTSSDFSLLFFSV